MKPMKLVRIRPAQVAPGVHYAKSGDGFVPVTYVYKVKRFGRTFYIIEFDHGTHNVTLPSGGGTITTWLFEEE